MLNETTLGIFYWSIYGWFIIGFLVVGGPAIYELVKLFNSQKK